MTIKLTHRQALAFLLDGYMTAAEYLKLCRERDWQPEQLRKAPLTPTAPLSTEPDRN